MNPKKNYIEDNIKDNMFYSDYKIKFGQCDPGGIMYFAELFDLAHWAYEDMLLESLPENNYFTHDQIVIPLVHAEADYINPLKLHQNVTLKLTVGDIKTTSFQLITEFSDQSENLSAKVKTVHVCVSKDSFDKTEIPNDLREALSKHLG